MFRNNNYFSGADTRQKDQNFKTELTNFKRRNVMNNLQDVIGNIDSESNMPKCIILQPTDNGNNFLERNGYTLLALKTDVLENLPKIGSVAKSKLDFGQSPNPKSQFLCYPMHVSLDSSSLQSSQSSSLDSSNGSPDPKVLVPYRGQSNGDNNFKATDDVSKTQSITLVNSKDKMFQPEIGDYSGNVSQTITDQSNIPKEMNNLLTKNKNDGTAFSSKKQCVVRDLHDIIQTLQSDNFNQMFNSLNQFDVNGSSGIQNPPDHLVVKNAPVIEGKYPSITPVNGNMPMGTFQRQYLVRRIQDVVNELESNDLSSSTIPTIEPHKPSELNQCVCYNFNDVQNQSLLPNVTNGNNSNTLKPVNLSPQSGAHPRQQMVNQLQDILNRLKSHYLTVAPNGSCPSPCQCCSMRETPGILGTQTGTINGNFDKPDTTTQFQDFIANPSNAGNHNPYLPIQSNNKDQDAPFSFPNVQNYPPVSSPATNPPTNPLLLPVPCYCTLPASSPAVPPSENRTVFSTGNSDNTRPNIFIQPAKPLPPPPLPLQPVEGIENNSLNVMPALSQYPLPSSYLNNSNTPNDSLPFPDTSDSAASSTLPGFHSSQPLPLLNSNIQSPNSYSSSGKSKQGKSFTVRKNGEVMYCCKRKDIYNRIREILDEIMYEFPSPKATVVAGRCICSDRRNVGRGTLPTVTLDGQIGLPDYVQVSKRWRWTPPHPPNRQPMVDQMLCSDAPPRPTLNDCPSPAVFSILPDITQQVNGNNLEPVMNQQINNGQNTECYILCKISPNAILNSS